LIVLLCNAIVSLTDLYTMEDRGMSKAVSTSHWRLRVTIAAVMAFAVALSAPVWSFNKGTHMVTAGIAYKVLKKESPSTLARVEKILKSHPCRSHWDTLAGPGNQVPPAAFLVMSAARWPDDVKETKGYYKAFHQYSQPTIHYLDIPFYIGKQKPLKPGSANLLTGYKAWYETLSNAKKSDKDKAVALCWIFHLTGDAHCPVHAISLVSDTYPEGDKGGNLFIVRAVEGGAAVKLHYLWDGFVLGSDNTQDVWNCATSLYAQSTAKPKPISSELAKTKYDLAALSTWVKTDNALAKKYAYLNGQLKGGVDAATATVLPPGYTQKAKAVDSKQVTLAGYRMARTLIALHAKGKL
jgi:hypothetical protein